MRKSGTNKPKSGYGLMRETIICSLLQKTPPSVPLCTTLNLGRGFPSVPRPCVHHWLVAPDEDWCDCDGTQHYHAWCCACGDERTFLRIVAWTLWDPEAADVIMEKGRRLA